ncbi:MAG TPA: hypothetical protein VM452_05670, partial [Caulifigura sp.]|nr:hypothetical protein [Caulifigura sp.]
MSPGPADASNLLPVLTASRPQFRPASAPMRWLIRITRALLVVAACFLIAAADRRAPSDPGDITLEDARQLFPTAARFG